MESTQIGDLVTVAIGGAKLAGIVFDAPSRSKLVVAVVEPGRGPVFRTVHPDAVSERAEGDPDDTALRLLIRRTPSPADSRGGGGVRGGRGRAGYSRGAPHRTTGR
jgi:hypothetical protein